MNPRKFYCTEIRLTVLSEGESVEKWELDRILAEIDEGDCVGEFSLMGVQELSAQEMADALVELGSDPAFFELDGEGSTL